ncbi:glycosyltransferase [Colwellia sp. D2M02]|uniref:glycosyltransferase family 2 protein n=1 Tax=Colwellia sp. D2M02 TaxID=2841562 RepID=UPI001C09C170|nr:glycosyltransferase [Colwellia sp. D2M02]MBU2891916.1 glycosyltransferase [Colwellia sp. D2M02]
MHNLPLVTVWIPTLNRQEMLKRALNSVLSQSYSNLEIFIVDNGSTDDTEAVVAEYQAKHNNIVYHRFTENKGACAARNYAIMHGKGELVTGLDDDDEFLPQRIKQLVAAYDERFAFVCTGYFWDYGAYRKAKIDTAMDVDLHAQLNFNQTSNQALVSRERIIEAGLFDEDLTSCQDWDMWTRLIIKYGTALRIAGASYIVHTAHDKPRITGNISNRLKGLEQFYSKHKHLMTAQNNKCFDFLRCYNAEKRLSIYEFLCLFNWPIKEQIIRYFIASQFPQLAEKRLARLRKK